MSDPIRDLKRELLAAAERQQRHATERAGHGRLRAHLGRDRLLASIATLVIAAVVALLFASPWSDSPGFLDRAQAALTADPRTVLHAKWEATWSSTDPACTIERGPNEIWIDQAPPHRFRSLQEDFTPWGDPTVDPRALVCSSGTRAELRGTLDSRQALRFEPPNAQSGSPVGFVLEPDPVRALREAISAGRAHDEGETELAGRTVERIRIDPPSNCDDPSCPHGPEYMYVDPDSFYPVEEHRFGAIVLDNVARFRVIRRYLTFEYLPRTAANLALTDVRAQHPNAIGP